MNSSGMSVSKHLWNGKGNSEKDGKPNCKPKLPSCKSNMEFNTLYGVRLFIIGQRWKSKDQTTFTST